MNQLCENCGHARNAHYWESSPYIHCRYFIEHGDQAQETCGCQELKINGMTVSNEQYTLSRKILAYIGIITIIMCIGLLAAAVVTGNQYLDANLAPITAQ